MNFTPSDYIAIAALIVSFISIGMSVYTTFLDRPRLSALAKYYPGNEDYGQAHIQIRVVNRGRRSAILRSFGGTLEAGGWSAEYLGEKDHGLRLGENGLHERAIPRDDVYTSTADCDSRFVDFWFEDSLGRRHEVKGSREAITALLSVSGDLRGSNKK